MGAALISGSQEICFLTRQKKGQISRTLGTDHRPGRISRNSHTVVTLQLVHRAEIFPHLEECCHVIGREDVGIKAEPANLKGQRPSAKNIPCSVNVVSGLHRNSSF